MKYNRIGYVANLKSPFQKELYRFLIKKENLYNYKVYHISQLKESNNSTNKIMFPFRLIYQLLNLNILNLDALLIEFISHEAFFYKILSLHKVPTFVRCHRIELYDYYNNHRKKFLYAIEFATLIMCVSNAMRERLAEIAPHAKYKSIVVYNSVDINKFKPLNLEQRYVDRRDGKFVIGSMGRFIESKGFTELIYTVARLIKKGYNNIILEIAGYGPLYYKINKLVEKLNIKKNVIIRGYIPHDETVKWYNSLDMFVLNSKIEGMPTVVLEAMATALPVVATSVGGIPEALDSEWIYEPYNLDRLEDLILKIYNMDPSKRIKIGMKNRLRVIDKFNLEKNSKVIIDLILKNINNI
ncbi:glycosyltransferase family 4 protein [Pyrodictium abyssi]|uniref:Glycosyl transferase family 1 domain-containing protein n=1 Tax=Pyrodictium abyssi TaxID=54256 RepID=A0ABM8IXV0_9CREN|nr:hypothetical protein PABY_19430 [Pyrodictium abyssi]